MNATLQVAAPNPPVDWTTLIGQDPIRHWFSQAIARGRLGGSFLFVGNRGVGKRTVAMLLARTLLCETVPPQQMQPCGRCEACVQVAALTHPDLIRVAKPEDRTFIPLELLIGPPDARMQQGFCREVRLRPFRGRRKVAIVEDADYLNEEGANCLLKTLEEPPANAIIVLIGSSEQKQLPTIRSRCQTVRFAAPRGEDAVRFVRELRGIDASPAQIGDAIETAGGDMQAAIGLLSGETDDLRQAIGNELAARFPDPVALQQQINDHVKQAADRGPKQQEAARKRDAIREVFLIAVQHYRGQLRGQAAQGIIQPPTWNRLDRSLRGLREVDRNANVATLIECYAADIAGGITGDRGEIGS